MNAHDWEKSNERVAATFAGETPDRVPFNILAAEAVASRVTGLTVREMLLSPEKLAKASIQTYEFLGCDFVSLVAPPSGYPGPFEAMAFAKVNRKDNVFLFKDYDTPSIREGKICETEKDIKTLEIPDHTEAEPYPTALKAIAIVKQETGIQQQFNSSLAWSLVQLLRGSKAYIDIRRNPELIIELCEKIYASQWDLYRAFCKDVGKPSFLFNSMYAFNRHMLSFEDAWKFEGQYIVRFCRESGLPLFIHNCGFDPYWDELIERLTREGVRVLGVNGNHPLDLDAWVRFRKKFHDIVIMGASIYINAEIACGSREDVMERVRQNITKLAPYKRFVISPTCNPTWRIPLPNLLAVGEAVQRYGEYP